MVYQLGKVKQHPNGTGFIAQLLVFNDKFLVPIIYMSGRLWVSKEATNRALGFDVCQFADFMAESPFYGQWRKEVTEDDFYNLNSENSTLLQEMGGFVYGVCCVVNYFTLREDVEEDGVGMEATKHKKEIMKSFLDLILNPEKGEVLHPSAEAITRYYTTATMLLLHKESENW